MYYHPKDHIYITQFRDEYIILDTIKDKYTICSAKLSNAFPDILKKNKLLSKNINLVSNITYSSKNVSFIKMLLDEDIIENKNTPYPFYIDQKPFSEGVSNVDWRLPLENKKIRINGDVFKAFLTIIKVNRYVKFKGFYSILQLIQKTRDSHLTYIVPPEEDLRELAHTVNTACFLYPSRIKCLEWAMTFVLMALKRQWKCNLEIGVQNYPFMAHAWVESGGRVVMDSQDLRKGLGIILNEPFRRTAE